MENEEKVFKVIFTVLPDGRLQMVIRCDGFNYMDQIAILELAKLEIINNIHENLMEPEIKNDQSEE